MLEEHTTSEDSADKFTTGNYEVTTTPQLEFAFVVKPDKFAASLSMPDGARTMLEREARGVKMIA